ncbi:hypothetical protein GH733_001892 [Mirounga leonina]|nr:hypothetical protein GH733_001892 [Mirounga leonina]
MERIQRLLKKRRSEYKCACDASSNRLCYVQRLLTVRWSNDGRHSMNGSNSYHSNEDDDDGGGGDNENENDHDALGLPTIRTPPNIYRVFVDVVNGEYVPCKLILKSRSRENSVCSDTSDDRRSVSCEEATCSDTSESILEEEQEENHHKKLLSLSGTPEAFSGTVVEKQFLSPSLTPHPTLVHPVLPTIPEQKEVLSEVSEKTTKRVSKFKAARLQQKS